MRTGRMKRGFTLIETVVTVGIVAAMAAVVIPQVAKQFDAADPTRLQNDLKNIQTAIETFTVNVKTPPGDLDDLANAIAITVDSSLGTANATTPVITATQAGLWNGPYVDFAILQAAAENVIITGYGARIVDSFVCYDSGNNEHGISDSTGTGAPSTAADNVACPTTTNNGQKFLAIQIIGITCVSTAGSDFMTLNELFDGTEATPLASGRVRCEAAATTGSKDTDVDVIFFLATPLG